MLFRSVFAGVLFWDRVIARRLLYVGFWGAQLEPLLERPKVLDTFRGAPLVPVDEHVCALTWHYP